MENEKRMFLIILLVYIIVFSSLSLLKHFSFNSTAFDLGLYDQTIWGYSEGKTIFNTVRGTYPFGDHVTPILFLVAPIYWIYSNPALLLVVQTIMLAAGAIPIYWLARDMINRKFGVAFAITYLIYPSLQYINLFDFHPDALMIPFFLFGFYYIEKEKIARGSLFLALAGMCKEYAPLLVSMIGLYFLVMKKKRIFAISLFLIGLAWFFVNIKIIIPVYRPEGFAYYNKYSYLGNGILEIISNAITHPFLIISNIITPGKIIYLGLLFLPVLAALASVEFLIALPAFAIMLLSSDTSYSAIVYQHNSMIIPFLFISAIYGIRRILRKRLMKPKVALGIIIALGIISYVAYGPFTVLYKFKQFDLNTEHVKAGYDAIKLIPDTASVSASSWIVPHLSHRNEIYMFPNPFYEVSSLSKPRSNSTDYLVLDVSRKDPMINSTDLEKYKKDAMSNKNYIKVFEKEGWIVLKRR